MDRLVGSYSEILLSKIFFQGKKPMFHKNFVLMSSENIPFMIKFVQIFENQFYNYIFKCPQVISMKFSEFN